MSEFVIGRNMAAEKDIPHPSISRKHCVISHNDNKAQIRNMSSGGMYVNMKFMKEKNESCSIHNGDKIVLTKYLPDSESEESEMLQRKRLKRKLIMDSEGGVNKSKRSKVNNKEDPSNASKNETQEGQMKKKKIEKTTQELNAEIKRAEELVKMAQEELDKENKEILEQYKCMEEVKEKAFKKFNAFSENLKNELDAKYKSKIETINQKQLGLEKKRRKLEKKKKKQSDKNLENESIMNQMKEELDSVRQLLTIHESERQVLESKIKGFAEVLEAEAQCTICSEIFVNSVTLLGCFHTFCQYCITEWKKQKTECPICRHKINKKNGEKRNFLVDNWIQSSIEKMPAQMKAAREDLIQIRARQASGSDSFERPSCSGTESNRGRVQTKKSIDNETKLHPSKCPTRKSVRFKSSSIPSTKTPRYEHSTVRTRFEHSPVRKATKTPRCKHYPVGMAPKTTRYDHSPVRTATTTQICKHYPVRMAPKTTRCEHSPVRTATKTPKCEHYPVRLAPKTQRCEHSPVRMAPKTTRFEHSPVRTATKTTRCEHSPIRTATKTTRCEHSPVRTATKTTRCEHSPVRKATKTARCEHSPVRTATKTTRFEHSPVRTVIKTTRCEHSPVRTATKTTRCKHSPVRTATKTTRCEHSPVRTETKTTRCDPSSIRNVNNVGRYSPMPTKNADRNRTYSSLPIRSVINTNGDVWLTRAMAKQLDKTHYLGISFREAVVYSLFLFCLTLVACSTMSMWMYWYNRLMNDLFIHSSFPGSYHVMKTFPQIINNNDFWLYTKIVLGRNLWYDIYPDDILDDSSVPESLTMWNVLFENRLIGHPRIRQLQVMNSSCDIHPDLADLFHWSCYGSFSEKTENRTSIGLQSGHAWTHSQFDSFWDSDYYTGLVGSYPYAGFYKDLSSNYEDFIAEIDELISNKWITRATRVVFIDFITYNANVNLFCFIKLVFEFPPVGGIIPSHEIQAFKLLRYVQSHDYLILLLEIFLFLFLLYYSWEELQEWSSMRRRGYYWSLWSYVDWVILLLGWLCFVLYLYRLILVELLLPRLLSQQHHPQFHVLLFIEKWCNSLLVLLLIVAWLKLIKYLNITYSTSRVYDTVSIAFSYLLAGIFLFITILIGFAFCGHLLFGSNKSGFYSVLSSSIIIMRCMWGGCNELSYEADIMTTIFFFIFSIVAIIFLGLLLAVLLDSYSTAKRQFRSFDNYGFYLRRRWRHLIAHLRREPPQDIEPNLMNQDEILDLLRRYNFSRPQIDHFLRKYSIHSNTQLDAKEVECLITDMENEAVISQQFITDSCLDRLESRLLCSVEGNLLSSINSKLNQIKSRIEHLEDRLDGLEPNDFT